MMTRFVLSVINYGNHGGLFRGNEAARVINARGRCIDNLQLALRTTGRMETDVGSDGPLRIAARIFIAR